MLCFGCDKFKLTDNKFGKSNLINDTYKSTSTLGNVRTANTQREFFRVCISNVLALMKLLGANMDNYDQSVQIRRLSKVFVFLT